MKNTINFYLPYVLHVKTVAKKVKKVFTTELAECECSIAAQVFVSEGGDVMPE
jgi:hypothetical protein